MLEFLNRSQSTVAIDIGSNSIKLVQLESAAKGGAWRLISHGMTTLPPESIVDGQVMNTSAIVESIGSLIAEKGIKAKNITASVSGNAVIIKRITLPMMSIDELEESIQWEAEQYIPFDINDVNIDVKILENSEFVDGSQMEVLLVAARRDLVNERMSLIQQSGFKPYIMDVDAFAVANMFEYCYEDLQGTIALVNIGSSSVNINILRDGNSIFNRDVSMGGMQFTNEIQRAMSISFEEAEALKVGGGEEDQQALIPQEIEDILTSVSETLASEVQRSLEFFRTTSGDGFIDQIYLSGGAAQTPGLLRAIQEQTGIDAEVVDPFRNIEVDERQFNPNFLDDTAPQFAVAVGLALRHEEDENINLLPKRHTRRQEAMRKEINKAGAGLLLVSFLLGFVHFYYMSNESDVATANNHLQGQISQNQRDVDRVEALEKEKAALREKLEAIDRLKLEKVGPVHMLDDLSSACPEKLQVLELSENQGVIKLEGISATNQQISKFLSNLDDSDYFADVNLNSIEADDKNGVQVKAFSITARFVVNPEAEAMAQEE
ncbi:MAG: type IV pilus assembly protein PilM [Myxococcota bacterium]|nr:type IV pilus assembly protein PilM [Myxococcota bacterium]